MDIYSTNIYFVNTAIWCQYIPFLYILYIQCCKVMKCNTIRITTASMSCFYLFNLFTCAKFLKFLKQIVCEYPFCKLNCDKFSFYPRRINIFLCISKEKNSPFNRVELIDYLNQRTIKINLLQMTKDPCAVWILASYYNYNSTVPFLIYINAIEWYAEATMFSYHTFLQRELVFVIHAIILLCPEHIWHLLQSYWFCCLQIIFIILIHRIVCEACFVGW